MLQLNSSLTARSPVDTCTRTATMNTTGACRRPTDTPLLLPYLHETCFTTHKHLLLRVLSSGSTEGSLVLCANVLSWDSCLVRGTLDTLWYCGYYSCYWSGLLRWLLVQAACGCLQLLRSWTCLTSCRAQNSCVEGLENLDKLRVESQLVNSLDQFCGQVGRS